MSPSRRDASPSVSRLPLPLPSPFCLIVSIQASRGRLFLVTKSKRKETSFLMTPTKRRKYSASAKMNLLQAVNDDNEHSNFANGLQADTANKDEVQNIPHSSPTTCTARVVTSKHPWHGRCLHENCKKMVAFSRLDDTHKSAPQILLSLHSM